MKKIIKKSKNKGIAVDELAITVNELSTTVDDLAIMVAKGFENMATKDDLKSFATKADFKIQQDISQIILKEIREMHEEHKTFRKDISALYTDNISYDRKIENLNVRVDKLELKNK